MSAESINESQDDERPFEERPNGILYGLDGKEESVRDKRITASKNVVKEGKQSKKRGPAGERYAEDKKDRGHKRTDRRHGIKKKISELNIVTGDHVYAEIYKPDQENLLAPDITQKVVWTTSKDLLKLPRGVQQSTPVVSARQPSVTPEEARNMTSSSASRSTRRLTDTCSRSGTSTSERRDRCCRVCSKSSDVPWIGCDLKEHNIYVCEYWVHACCIGFVDADDKSFEDLAWRCPRHRGKNKRVASTSLFK